jgi:hypothetical protein
MSQVPEWVRSFALTAFTTFLVTVVPVVTSPDFEWTQATIIAAVVAGVTAGIRTAVSAWLPGGSFGTQPTDPYGH